MMNTMRATNNHKVNKIAVERACMNHTKVWNQNAKEFTTLDCVVFFKDERLNPAAYFASSDLSIRFNKLYEISGSCNGNNTFAITEREITRIAGSAMHIMHLNAYNEFCEDDRKKIVKVVLSNGRVLFPEV